MPGREPAPERARARNGRPEQKLGGGSLVAKRQSINIGSGGHAAPIPMGSRIGNVVYSSAIGGRDEALGKIPDDPDEQAVAVFNNVRAFMKACGGTPDNIIHMRLLMKDDKYRENLNKEWVK